MIAIMNSTTGEIIGTVECAYPSLGDLTTLRTTINLENDWAYSLIWQNEFVK